MALDIPDASTPVVGYISHARHVVWVPEGRTVNDGYVLTSALLRYDEIEDSDEPLADFPESLVMDFDVRDQAASIFSTGSAGTLLFYWRGLTEPVSHEHHLTVESVTIEAGRTSVQFARR